MSTNITEPRSNGFWVLMQMPVIFSWQITRTVLVHFGPLCHWSLMCIPCAIRSVLSRRSHGQRGTPLEWQKAAATTSSTLWMGVGSYSSCVQVGSSPWIWRWPEKLSQEGHLVDTDHDKKTKTRWRSRNWTRQKHHLNHHIVGDWSDTDVCLLHVNTVNR